MFFHLPLYLGVRPFAESVQVITSVHTDGGFARFVVADTRVTGVTCVKFAEERNMEQQDKIKAHAKGHHEHARKCKVNNPVDCALCVKGMEFFKSLPLQTLSRVLSE